MEKGCFYRVYKEYAMFLRIFLYLGLMCCGVFVGRSGKLGKRVLQRLDSIQTVCLLFLLFAMGMSMGMDEKVMSSFSTLGFRSFVFSASAISCSVLAVFVFNRLWNSVEKPVKECSMQEKKEEKRL